MIKLELALCILLLLLFYQDLKSRSVSVLVLLAVTALSIVLSIHYVDEQLWLPNTLRSIGILVSMILLSTFFRLLISKEAGIAPGDIWMLLLCGLGMSANLLLPFLCASFAISLLVYFLFRSTRFRWDTIPLAGMLSLLMALLILVDVLLPFSRYTEIISLYDLIERVETYAHVAK